MLDNLPLSDPTVAVSGAALDLVLTHLAAISDGLPDEVDQAFTSLATQLDDAWHDASA